MLSKLTYLTLDSHSMYYLFIFVFLMISASLSAQNSVEERTLDSLTKLYQNSKIDTIKCIALNELAWTYAFLSHKTSEDYANKAIKFAQKIKYLAGEANGYNMLGIVARFTGRYDESVRYHLKSMKLYEDCHNQGGIANNYSNLGLVYQANKNYDKALDYYQKALALKQKIGDQKGVGYTLYDIASLYVIQKKYKKALEVNQNNLMLRQNIRDSIGIASIYKNLGELYYLLNDKKEAINFLIEGEKISIKTANRHSVIQIYQLLSSIYLDNQELDKAMQYTQKSYEIATKYAMKDDIAKAFELKSKIYAAQKKFDQAYQAQSIFMLYKDSLNLSEIDKKLSSAQASYQLDKKQSEIDMLNKLKKTEEQNKNMIIFTFIGILVILILFLIYFYYNSSTRKKINSELEGKNKELNQKTEELKNINFQIIESSAKLEELLEETHTQKEVLELKNQALEALQNTKDLMISAVNHDLRNPLNPILNFSSPDYPQKDKDKLMAMIHERAKTMLALINDIMDVYKADKITLNPQTASLHKAGEEAIKVISEAQLKMPDIINEIPVDAKAKFEYKYIERVLENLLSNAVKYTKPKEQGGQVRLFISPLTPEGGLRVCVQDNGMGIPQDKFEEIFLPFSNPNAKNIGGAKSVGIGLTFCKTIVEAHGSRIEVQSEVGKGSTFSFLLPAVTSFGEVSNFAKAVEIVLNEEEKALLLPLVEELKTYRMQNARVRLLLQKMDTHNLPALQNWQKVMLQAREQHDVESFEKYLAIV